MRKVVASHFVSLDGVAEPPDEFVTEFDDDALGVEQGRGIATTDAVLLGRRTYDAWAPFWPTSDIEPFASFINGVDKFVVTSTAPDVPWANTSVVDGDPFQLVTELKQRDGGDIAVLGSISLTQSLLEAGLVDELRLAIAPTLHMRGRRLIDGDTSRKLTLTRHFASASGFLFLDYTVSR